MKEIDEKLNQWIYNSIIRAEIRELILKYASEAFADGKTDTIGYKDE
tara:strand:+ start:509 stop:649 length:141 start_codon:yes stop_codon:yes gene_type:complete